MPNANMGRFVMPRSAKGSSKGAGNLLKPHFILQYQSVLDFRQARFNEYFDDQSKVDRHEAAHVRLLEIEGLFKTVSGRREYRLLQLAVKLLADGLCNVACANYQLAFYCLRSFFEFSTAAIKFSAFEIELRQWENGNHDIQWGSVSVGERGVFSKSFASAFLTSLADEYKHYETLASRVYREASEYVHGNPTSHAGNDHDEIRIQQYFALFDAALTCAIYGFFLRYNSDVDFSEDTNPEISHIIDEDLGHFPGVKEIISSGKVKNG